MVRSQPCVYVDRVGSWLFEGIGYSSASRLFATEMQIVSSVVAQSVSMSCYRALAGRFNADKHNTQM